MSKKEKMTDPCDKKARKFNARSCMSIFLSVLMLLTSVDYMQIQAQEVNAGEVAADTESEESTEAEVDMDNTENPEEGEDVEIVEDGEEPCDTESVEYPEEAVGDEGTEEVESTQNLEEVPDEIQFVKTSEGAVVLSSFEPLSETESHIVLEKKGTLEEVLSLMPSVLKAYALVQVGETETSLQEVEVPVIWGCREDYDNTELESYVFMPEWDNTAYYYESGIPVIVIRIAEGANDGEVATQEELQAALAMGMPEITLTEDIALTGTLTVPASADTVLDGNGFSLKRGTDEGGVFTGAMIYLGGEDYTEEDYGKLTLADICIDGTTPEDRAGSSVIINYGSLILDEGAVIQSNSNYGSYPPNVEEDAQIRDYGGGIQVYGDLQVTERALIAGNFANEFGGGVYLEDGALLCLFADVIVANRVAEGTGYGADLYAASGSTIFYDSSIDMERDEFYLCEGANLICLQGAVEEYAETALSDEEVRNDGKVEVYVSVAEGSGYSVAQLAEIENKLEALGYSVISEKTNIDVTDFRDWYVFDHYDTYVKCWGSDKDGNGVPNEWNARYGGNPRRKYYPCTEQYAYFSDYLYDDEGNPMIGDDGNQLYGQVVQNPVYTIADWLASDEYYSKFYKTLNLARFKEHIYQGMQGGHPMMMFVGYGNPAYIDFMFYDPESSGEKVVNFDIDSSLVNVHTLAGAGFLVNTGIKDNKLYGYLVYYEYTSTYGTGVPPASLSVYKLDGKDVDSFHNGAYDLKTSKDILGTAQKTYGISSSNWKTEMSVQINITSNKIEVRQQPKNASVDIDQIEPVLSMDTVDTGYSGFGPLVSYTSYNHNCSQASSFTYSNIAMYYTDPAQAGQNILQSLEKADYTQGGTQKYFVNLFGDSGLDYNNASVETGLYQEYLKLMQVEGVALITDRDTPFEDYLGKSGEAGSNLCEIDRGMSVDELVARIKEYVDQQTTTYMQNKLQPGEGGEGLTNADPKQSVGNCWLQSATENQQVRTLWGDSLTDEGYEIRMIDDISYYYGDNVTVSYEILKPGSSAYEPLPAASVTVGNDSKEWPTGQYTVRQTISSSIGEASVHGYAYFVVKRNDSVEQGHTHTWGEYATDGEPTCTDGGHRYRVCKTCGERQEEDIPALGHSPKEGWSSNAADHWHECSVCGEKFDTAVHEFEEWVTDVKPTCTENGQRHRVCETCQKRQEEEIPASGHSPKEEWSSDEADHWHDCSACDEKFDTAAHEFGEWITDDEPTCTEAGQKHRVCKDCKEKQEEEIQASGHSLAEDWSSNETDHWRVCSVCKKKLDVENHKFDEWVIDLKATEEEEGAKHRVCSTCDYREDVTIPTIPHQHVFEELLNNETSHWLECRCGEKSDVAFHDFEEWITGKEASEDGDGDRYRICGVCEYTEHEPIKLGNLTKREDCGKDVPPTVISMQLPELAAAMLHDEDRHALGIGSDITIVLTVDDADDTVSEEDKAAVASRIGSYILGQYFDVNLYKEMDGEKVQVTETDNEIRIIMAVPERLKNMDENASRNFAVIRVHDGDAVILGDLDSEDGTVTIDTDRFSTYALVYEDKEVSTADQIKENVNRVKTVSTQDPPEGQRDPEPRTSHTSHIELYATIALIEGLSYLMLMFTSEHGMTEKKKKELMSVLIEWAKEGGALCRLLALAGIFMLLAYYHSIGKQVTEEWTSVCRG